MAASGHSVGVASDHPTPNLGQRLSRARSIERARKEGRRLWRPPISSQVLARLKNMSRARGRGECARAAWMALRNSRARCGHSDEVLLTLDHAMEARSLALSLTLSVVHEKRSQMRRSSTAIEPQWDDGGPTRWMPSSCERRRGEGPGAQFNSFVEISTDFST